MVGQFGDDVKLPPTTVFLIWVTDFLTWNTSTIIATVVFGWFAWTTFFSTALGKQLLDKYIFHLPLIGKVTKFYDLVKFMRYMRLLLEAWMNFLEVFEFLQTIMTNESYKVMISDVIDSINRWETIGWTLEHYTEFIPKNVVALLKVWEETASFESALSNAITMYEAEFNKVLDGLSKVIEPVLIVFIWWIVAMVALSVFWVIGTLLESVQTG
jgi:type IV pilus assembly protein PilC